MVTFYKQTQMENPDNLIPAFIITTLGGYCFGTICAQI